MSCGYHCSVALPHGAVSWVVLQCVSALCPDHTHFLWNKWAIYSRGTKVAYRAKTHIFCTREVYNWNFVY